MALLYIDSFDHYLDAQILKKWNSSGVLGPGTISVGAGRCGTNALNLGALKRLYKGIVLTGGATANVGFMGFAYKPTAISGQNVICGTSNAGASSNFQWNVRINNSGAIEIYGGDSDFQVATAAGLLHIDEWAFLEFGWTIHPTLGAMTVRVNNVQVLAATNLDLQNGSFADNNWTSIVLGSNNNNSGLFDDLYVLDDQNDGLTPATNTFLGDSRVEYLRPTADGTYVGEWTVVGGGTQFNAVDKNYDPSPATPYIQSATVGQRATDVYNDLAVTSGSIFGVQVSVLATKDNAGFRTIAAMAREAGVDATGTAFSPSQASTIYGLQLWQRDPTTLAAWSVAGVNAAEFGVKTIT